MNETLSRPREGREENKPVLEKLDVPAAKRARFMGTGGFNIKKLTADTGRSVEKVVNILKMFWLRIYHNQMCHAYNIPFFSV